MRKLLVSLGVIMTLGGFGLAATAGPAVAGDPKPCKGNPSDAADCIPTTTTTTVVPTTTVSESPGANCSHGVNDDGTCRPDPNEHGQDCDEHGNPNPAGNDGNEDHCLPTTTTTTTSSAPPPTTTTTTVVIPCEQTEEGCPTTTTEPPVTTTTEPPVVTTTTEPPATTTTATTAPPITTTTNEPPKHEPNDGPDKTEGPGKLAFTGPEDLLPLGLAALGLLSTGTGLMWAGRKRDED